MAYLEKVSCSNSSSECHVTSPWRSCQCSGDMFQDVCAGMFMEMEEAREKSESGVVAKQEEKFRRRGVTAFF